MDIKAVGEFFTQASRGLESGDLLPRIISGEGAAVVGGTMIGASVISNGVKARNNAKIGKVVYGDGPDRMTQSFTTGVVPAINRIAKNNYGAFSELTESAIEGTTNTSITHKLEDYGVNDKFVSAFYGMK